MGLVAVGTLAGILLVPVGVLYQDVRHALTICISALIFFTPVLYPPPQGGMLGKIMEYNPIAPFFTLCREMLFSGRLGSIYQVLAEFAVTLVLVLIGWVLYRVSLPILVERMEA